MSVVNLQLAVEESHDLMKFAEANGIERKHNPQRVLRTAVKWAIDEGHIDQPPKGWA